MTLAIIFALSDSFRSKNKQEKRKFLHVNSPFAYFKLGKSKTVRQLPAR